MLLTVFALCSYYSHLRTQNASVLSSKTANNQQPPRKSGMTFYNSWMSQLLVTILPGFLPLSLVGQKKKRRKSDNVLIWIILPTKLSPWVAVEFVSHPPFQNCGWQLSSISSRCQVTWIIPWGVSLHPLELLRFWCPHPSKAEGMCFPSRLPGTAKFCYFSADFTHRGLLLSQSVTGSVK